MEKEKSMTKQETEEMMKQLEKVFSIVRILDVEGLETANSFNKGKMPDHPCQCYSFWNRDTRCENCISARVLADKKQRTKIEFIDSDMYQVISRYIEIDNVPHIIEMINCLDSDTLIDSDGRKELIGKIAGFDKEIYLDVLTGAYNRKVVFDLFYRKNPSGNGFAITAGLQQAIEYLDGLHFTEEDIAYLESLNLFSEDFIDYLRSFRFTGEVYAVPEGTIVFPHEPLMRIKAPIIEAQLIETALLNIINHQSLIATKASRVVHAAQGDPVLEFGLRRAQGPDAGTVGARAAVIGGCVATSNVLTGKLYDVPVKGTHAHSWVMSFPDELTAFRTYANLFPDACILLVDTYNTLKSGVPHAIQVFDEMKAAGTLPEKGYGIRLDSGDLAYLSKRARQMLDEAGYPNAVISASSDLDENLITSLKLQGATITLWGVGTKLITSDDCPAFGGVYKLAAEETENGDFEPKIKLSNNVEKVTNPGIKKIIRIYDKKTGKIKADLLALEEEEFTEDSDLYIYDTNAKWKSMQLPAGSFTLRELLVPIFVDGKLVYECPKAMDIQAYCNREKDTLWEEQKRLKNPDIVPVDLSDKLSAMKLKLIEAATMI